MKSCVVKSLYNISSIGMACNVEAVDSVLQRCLRAGLEWSSLTTVVNGVTDLSVG